MSLDSNPRHFFFFFTLRYYVFMQFKESRWDVKTRKEILEKGDLVCAKVL